VFPDICSICPLRSAFSCEGTQGSPCDRPCSMFSFLGNSEGEVNLWLTAGYRSAFSCEGSPCSKFSFLGRSKFFADSGPYRVLGSRFGRNTKRVKYSKRCRFMFTTGFISREARQDRHSKHENRRRGRRQRLVCNVEKARAVCLVAAWRARGWIRGVPDESGGACSVRLDAVPGQCRVAVLCADKSHLRPLRLGAEAQQLQFGRSALTQGPTPAAELSPDART
jgi:hypothetical protein